MTTLSKWMKIVLPVGFTLFFLYLALKGIRLEEFRDSIQKTSWSLVAVASVMALMSIYLRAWRWQILLVPVKSISYQRVLSKTMIGFMANNILPAHAGDLVRGVMLGRQEAIPVTAALTTIVVERLFDGIALATIMVIVLLSIDLPVSLQNAGFFISLMCLFLLVFLYLLAYSRAIREWVLAKISGLRPRWRDRLEPQFKALINGIEILRQPGKLITIVAISLAVWIQMCLTIFLIMKMFPVAEIADPDLMMASATLMVFLAFAVALPSTPGYVGVTQAVFVFTLSLFFVAESDALSCSILFNATQYIPVTVAGFYYLFKEGLGIKSLLIAKDVDNIPHA